MNLLGFTKTFVFRNSQATVISGRAINQGCKSCRIQRHQSVNFELVEICVSAQCSLQKIHNKNGKTHFICWFTKLPNKNKFSSIFNGSLFKQKKIILHVLFYSLLFLLLLNLRHAFSPFFTKKKTHWSVLNIPIIRVLHDFEQFAPLISAHAILQFRWKLLLFLGWRQRAHLSKLLHSTN